MQIKTLYRYTRPDGGITNSIEKPENAEYTTRCRLIADDNGAITDGTTVCECIDVDSSENWRDCTKDELKEYIAKKNIPQT